MKQYTIRLSVLILCAVTNAALAMDSEMNLDIRVMIKNLSTGLANNTYDIYVQIVPTLNASQHTYEEILIPYNETKTIGMLARINDIKTRGSSLMSSWTYNEDLLNKIKQEAKSKYATGKQLLLLTTAGIAGFYISYYNWV